MKSEISGSITDTHKVFAQLSAQSYQSRGNDIPHGWSEVFSSEKLDLSLGNDHGYFGRVFKKDIDGSYIIGHSGTNDLADLDDDANIFFSTALKQYEIAKQFIDYVINYINENDNNNTKTLAFTGHSLGAALSVLSAADYHYPAISFDDPGVALQEIVQENIDYVRQNVITYNAAPNLVNTGGYHDATLYRLYVPYINTETNEYLYKETYPQPTIDHYGAVFTTFSQHSIKLITESFNEDGNPRVMSDYTDIKDQWPSGITTGNGGLDDYKSISCNPYYWHQYIKSKNEDNVNYRNSVITKNILEHLGTLDSAHDNTQRLNIKSDNSGNLIWGTRSAGCDIYSGTGDDEFKLYGINNIVKSEGGHNIFDIYGKMQTTKDYIFQTYNVGKTIISSLGNDEIYLTDKKINGKAIYCESSDIGDIYFLLTDENDGFKICYDDEQSLKIFLEEPESLSDSNKLNNYIELTNFSWEKYGITLEENPEQYEVIFATNQNSYINCEDICKNIDKEYIILNLARSAFIDLVPQHPIKIIGKHSSNMEISVKNLAQEINSNTSSAIGKVEIYNFKPNDEITPNHGFINLDDIKNLTSHLGIKLHNSELYNESDFFYDNINDINSKNENILGESHDFGDS